MVNSFVYFNMFLYFIHFLFLNYKAIIQIDRTTKSIPQSLDTKDLDREPERKQKNISV